MNYILNFDEELEIVHVVYDGKVSLAERKQAVIDVCEAYEIHKSFKIIVDVRKLVMHLSFAEQKEFGEYLSNHAGLTNARVAVLHKPDHNPNAIVDTVAFNNGYVLCEFNRQKDAEDWLLQR